VGPVTTVGGASTVKTLNERQRLSPEGQKFTFFRITGTDIVPEPGSAKSPYGVKNRYAVAEMHG
jgi:hypothetical protein